MPKRQCSICGKEKEVYGGKECPNGHFTCKEDYYRYGTRCKICNQPLR